MNLGRVDICAMMNLLPGEPLFCFDDRWLIRGLRPRFYPSTITNLLTAFYKIESKRDAGIRSPFQWLPKWVKLLQGDTPPVSNCSKKCFKIM
jgi:hypothetical protein